MRWGFCCFRPALDTYTFDNCFIYRLRQLTDLYYKWREFIKMMSFTCCQGAIPPWIVKTVLYPPAEIHSGTSQTSKADFFMRLLLLILNCFSFTIAPKCKWCCGLIRRHNLESKQCNIFRGKDIQAMKSSQLIEYNIRNNFLQK